MVAEEEQPVLCEVCHRPMEKIETHDCVEISYGYNTETKEYEELDVNYCGSITTEYSCHYCKDELFELRLKQQKK